MFLQTHRPRRRSCVLQESASMQLHSLSNQMAVVRKAVMLRMQAGSPGLGLTSLHLISFLRSASLFLHVYACCATCNGAVLLSKSAVLRTCAVFGLATLLDCLWMGALDMTGQYSWHRRPQVVPYVTLSALFTKASCHDICMQQEFDLHDQAHSRVASTAPPNRTWAQPACVFQGFSVDDLPDVQVTSNKAGRAALARASAARFFELRQEVLIAASATQTACILVSWSLWCLSLACLPALHGTLDQFAALPCNQQQLLFEPRTTCSTP